MSSGKTRDYDPMSDDGYDSKIPLHNDEAFQHGIHFDAKVRSMGESIDVTGCRFLVHRLVGSAETHQSGGNRRCDASDSRESIEASRPSIDVLLISTNSKRNRLRNAR